jgi:hypothetical protein
MFKVYCRLKLIGAALSAIVLYAGSAAAQVTCSGTWPPATLTNGTAASASDVMSNFTYLYNCLTGITFPGGGTSMAQGRLTLATGTPVMTGAQTGKTVIYYTPYVGNQMPVTTNGTSFTATTFSELSNITTASSSGNAGPAAVAANSNYDLFVWSNSGTLTLTRGPAWTSDTARGTGAGTSELQRVAGIWTNKNAMTNGPGANLGTYVGTVRSNGSSTIDWQPGGVAAGGTAAVLGVWNTFNRLGAKGFVGDSTASWNYTTATVRPANNSTAMRVSYVQGLQEDFFDADYVIGGTNGAPQNAGICYDSTSAFSGRVAYIQAVTTAAYMPIPGAHAAQDLGFHFMQACEYSAASGTSTWFSTGGVGQYGMRYSGMF